MINKFIILLLLPFSVHADLTFNWTPPLSVDGVIETGYEIYCDDALLAEIDGFTTNQYIEPSVNLKVPDGPHSCDMETIGTEDTYNSIVRSERSVPVLFDSINGSIILVKPSPINGLFMTVN